MSISLKDAVLIEHMDGSRERLRLRDFLERFVAGSRRRLSVDFDRQVGVSHQRVIVASDLGCATEAEWRNRGYHVIKAGPRRTTLVRFYYVIRNRKGKVLAPAMLKAAYYAETGIDPDAGAFYWRGGRFRKYSCSLCYPQSTNERRQSFPCREEGEPPVRGRRSFNHLPNAWDDILRDGERCWKTQRKVRKQWMRT